MSQIARLSQKRTWLISGFFLLVACSACASDEYKELAVETSSVLPLNDTGEALPNLLPEEPPPPGAQEQFKTDFSKHSVPYAEILSGGPPKDGIPAIDNTVHQRG